MADGKKVSASQFLEHFMFTRVNIKCSKNWDALTFFPSAITITSAMSLRTSITLLSSLILIPCWVKYPYIIVSPELILPLSW